MVAETAAGTTSPPVAVVEEQPQVEKTAGDQISVNDVAIVDGNSSSSPGGNNGYGRLPAVNVVCPNCKRTAPETKLDHEPGFASYLTFMGLFVVGLWPLLWLPFCNMTRLPDTYHRCPNCGVCMGRHKVLDLGKMCGNLGVKSSSVESLTQA